MINFTADVEPVKRWDSQTEYFCFYDLNTP